MISFPYLICKCSHRRDEHTEEQNYECMIEDCDCIGFEYCEKENPE